MDIIVRQPYLILKSFELRDLPDFVVLTGENGTGKTQLLSYLHNTSRINYEMMLQNHYDTYSDESTKQQTLSSLHDEIRMNLDVMDMESGSYNSIAISDSVAGFNEDGSLFVRPVAEIITEGKHATNIIFRDVQAPSVDLGNAFDKNSLLKEGDLISQKYFFYLSHPEFFNIPKLDSSKLNTQYSDWLGLKKSGESYVDSKITFPTFSLPDIDTIKKIVEEHGEVSPRLVPYYYVVHRTMPNSSLFSANLKFLYIQYWARKQAGLELGEAPWVTFNKIADAANIRYQLDIPNIDAENYNFEIRLKNTISGATLNPDSLSSGEKVIFSLILAIYSSNTIAQFPEVILFDEPDAYLHPSLCKQMLDVIQDVLIKDKKIKVIITTHSPTTVALSPEKSLYKMEMDDSGMCSMNETDKKEAIRSLTSGLKSISVLYENIKQVFVEAAFDKKCLWKIYEILVQKGYLDDEIGLQFLNVGSDKETGGCNTLKSVVSDLSISSNSNVYGIIDWDKKVHEAQNRIKILGDSQRYAIDNYIYDPIGVAILILSQRYKYDIEAIGFSKDDAFIDFRDKTQDNIQQIINNIISKLEVEITDTSIDKAPCRYKTVNGYTFTIPTWFLQMKGHSSKDKPADSIFDLYKKAFDFFKDQNVADNIISQAYRNYPEFIPVDILETFKSIQETE